MSRRDTNTLLIVFACVLVGVLLAGAIRRASQPRTQPPIIVNPAPQPHRPWWW